MQNLLLLLTLLFLPPLAEAIEQSITPLLDHHHQLKNLDPKKYSQNQFKAIQEALQHKTSMIRIVSYNMLYDRYDHLLPVNLRWKERVKRIALVIDEMHADIICFQELYPKQLLELHEEINDDYFYAGKLPAPQDTPQELNGIFLRKGRFQCKEVSTWYLSETPNEPSSDPYSTDQKTVTEAHLTDWLTKKELAVFCTHASFGSADSREFAAKKLINYIEPFCQNKAVILAGDFNTFAARIDEPLLPYHDGAYILKILTSRSLRNAKDTALIGTLGPLSTYTNREGALMPFQGTGIPGVFLDHIFVGGSMAVLLQAVQPATVDGLFGSSHMPVIADCVNLN